MGVIEVEETSLKRSADDCNEDLTNPKVKKLEDVSSCDDEQSSSGNDSSDDVELRKGRELVFSLTPKKDIEEKQLSKGKVFEQMMNEFSKVEPPQQIIYGKFEYGIEAYAEFWEHLFLSPKYTTGYNMKLVNNSLDRQTLLAIAKILKRGWEDERFFPKRLAWPFLEACIFNRETENELVLKPDMFYKYIEDKERKILESNGRRTIDRENIKVFQKYYPEAPISIGDTIESACKKVLGKIVFNDVENVRFVWTEELVGLLQLEIFKFLEEEQPTIPSTSEKDVGTIAPHRLWSTFFYGWSDKMKEFYFKLLKNDNFERCKICDRHGVNGKHIVSTEEDDPSIQAEKHFEMLTKRHDNVLNEIVKQVQIALDSRRNIFSGTEDWQLIVMYENYRKPWPQELNMLTPLYLFPHIVLYCSSPRKLALIMDLTLSWDCWATYGSIHYRKDKKYSIVVETLRENGFEAGYVDLKVGARGIWSADLDFLFDKICGMQRSEINKTMEQISKIIIEDAFDAQYNNLV